MVSSTLQVGGSASGLPMGEQGRMLNPTGADAAIATMGTWKADEGRPGGGDECEYARGQSGGRTCSALKNQ